jgi:hypothetical protein
MSTGAVRLEEVLATPDRFTMDDLCDAIFASELVMPFDSEGALVMAGSEGQPTAWAYTSESKHSEGGANHVVTCLIAKHTWKRVAFGPLIPMLADNGVPVAVNAGTTPSIVLPQDLLRRMAAAIGTGQVP